MFGDRLVLEHDNTNENNQFKQSQFVNDYDNPTRWQTLNKNRTNHMVFLTPFIVFFQRINYLKFVFVQDKTSKS